MPYPHSTSGDTKAQGLGSLLGVRQLTSRATIHLTPEPSTLPANVAAARTRAREAGTLPASSREQAHPPACVPGHWSRRETRTRLWGGEEGGAQYGKKDLTKKESIRCRCKYPCDCAGHTSPSPRKL